MVQSGGVKGDIGRSGSDMVIGRGDVFCIGCVRLGDGCEVEIDCLGVETEGEVVAVAVDGWRNAQTISSGSDVKSEVYAARGAGGSAIGGSPKPGQ